MRKTVEGGRKEEKLKQGRTEMFMAITITIAIGEHCVTYQTKNNALISSQLYGERAVSDWQCRLNSK